MVSLDMLVYLSKMHPLYLYLVAKIDMVYGT
jgi:hypothetical protein